MAAKKNKSSAPMTTGRGTSRPPPSKTRKLPFAAPAPTSLPSPAVALGRISKGKRPQFHDSEAVDQLFAVVTALTAELSVAFDRIDTIERVLVASGAITNDRIETFQVSDAAADIRNAKREALIQRVFSVFEAYGAP